MTLKVPLIVAIEEIKLLKSRRDRACDTKDWDLYRALHADELDPPTDSFQHPPEDHRRTLTEPDEKFNME